MTTSTPNTTSTSDTTTVLTELAAHLTGTVLATETVPEHPRLGAGSDLLRLPVSRVRLRWA
ncbi:hypothetical protein [Nakamurella leprariae]|uniref:Uncharacterized protein n=1 Tax=Nakamurella leprariae TaxID=2803911 RepID=A0A939C0K9_9ACTN|nr:hypothetical protein [Nakamurella leprariae]MBM9466257.1 hypothetical protein [Nakamurella leprariae]